MPAKPVSSKKAAVQPKAKAAAAPAFATLSERLKALRLEFHHTQEDMGRSGLVSAPGWIKIENGQRQPSEGMIYRLSQWFHPNNARNARKLEQELLLLKYLSDPSEYIRGLALDRFRAQAQSAVAGKGGASK